MQIKKTKILAVVGPTASGKSALALALAQRLDGEIVSCDSMQIYRQMDIGTAKPSEEEQSLIRHHMIDVADPDVSFSCADYVEMCGGVIEKIASRGRLPIVCGGTGLYLDSLLRGGFEETKSDPALREELFAYAATHGNRALHDRLAAVDPQSAKDIHENNVKRVVRALEIYETTGLTKTETDANSHLTDSPYEAVVIGLRYAKREALYERIDRRVDQMMEEGLLRETEQLYRKGVFARNGTAAQAIGYKELLGFLAGDQTLALATEALKTATRRYAKRQMTWFCAKDYVRWIDVTEEDGTVRSSDAVLRDALQIWTNAFPKGCK